MAPRYVPEPGRLLDCNQSIFELVPQPTVKRHVDGAVQILEMSPEDGRVVGLLDEQAICGELQELAFERTLQRNVPGLPFYRDQFACGFEDVVGPAREPAAVGNEQFPGFVGINERSGPVELFGADIEGSGDSTASTGTLTVGPVAQRGFDNAEF